MGLPTAVPGRRGELTRSAEIPLSRLRGWSRFGGAREYVRATSDYLPLPAKRGEGWGEGFELVNICLLTPPLSSLSEEREKKCNAWLLHFRSKLPFFHLLALRHPFFSYSAPVTYTGCHAWSFRRSE